jgi:hypothetical protein
MTTTERLANKIKEIVALKDTIKLRDNKILEQQDKLSALANENGVLERDLNKWVKQQENGYCWWIKNQDGNILDMGIVPPYSQFTYTQKIPKEIGTAKYQAIPFYIEENKATKIDTQKYMRYNSI